MERTSALRIAVMAVVLGGCATQANLARIDAKYDHILTSDCGGDRAVCGLQEQNRIREKEYAGNVMRKLQNYLGFGGASSSTGPDFGIIMNPR